MATIIRGRLSQWDCKQIGDYRKCKCRAREVFHIVYLYCGQPTMEHCIYYGSKMVGHAPTIRRAVSLRNYFYKNPEILM